MNLTLKQMRYVLAVLNHGSIARAARALHITQSPIVAAVDQAVAELGQAVGARIETFLDEARVQESDLMSLTGNPAGPLRPGCYAPAAPYILPPILGAIRVGYPSIRIELQAGGMQDIHEMLA